MDHAAIVRHIVGRCIARSLPANIEKDDLYQVGYLAAIGAEARWNPAKGPFGTFAYRRIYGEMIDWIRSQDPSSRTAFTDESKAHLRRRWVSIDALRPEWFPQRRNGDAQTELVAPETSYSDPILQKRALAALEMLPARERHAVVATVLNGRLLKDIAGELGVKESRASQLRQRGLRQLRRSLNGERHAYQL